uniref:AP2/ERF domain-containing protein n=1 Tax=Araucaria cunninghamii TaxID=56994 RepID=A0A0D6R8B2_ARACU
MGRVKSLKPEVRPRKWRPNLRGIARRKWGKWVSEIRMPNSRAKIWLGTYDTPQQAARAYDFAVYCLRGPNAQFNFPISLQEVPSVSSLSGGEIRAAAARFALQEFPLKCGEKCMAAETGGSCACSVSELESFGDEKERGISSEKEIALPDSVLGKNGLQALQVEMAKLSDLAFPSPIQEHGGIIFDQDEWWGLYEWGRT